MKKNFFLALAGSLLLTISALAADATGTWKASVPGRQGNTMEVTMSLKADGGKLSGTVDGGMGGAAEISDGKVDGDKVSFNVKREFQGRSMVMQYEGTVKGDEIQFKQTMQGMDRPPREFTAKRAK